MLLPMNGAPASIAVGGARGKSVICNVATPSKAPTLRAAKRSKVEIIKEVGPLCMCVNVLCALPCQCALYAHRMLAIAQTLKL